MFWRRWKIKDNFALNDKRVLFPKHRIEIALEFSNVYSSLRNLFIYGDTPISKFVTLKILAKVMMYNIRSATFDGKYVNFYLIANVKFAQSHSLRDIRKTRKMPQFCRQVEGVEKLD